MAHFGGSLLPSSGHDTYTVLNGKFGEMKVVALPEFEEHALVFRSNVPIPAWPDHVPTWSMLATHVNGYSCKALADRILDVWNGKRESVYALEQFDYILACGGLGRNRSAIEFIVDQK